jgi:RNA polymerase sigma factor (sigma-70 family)
MRSLLGRGRRPAGPPGTAEPSGGSPRARLLALADEELMALAAGADADAFEILHDRHAGVAFSLAYRICGDRASAEDAYQDAMLSVWRSAERYRPHLGSVRSWILTLVHHRAIDLVRRRARVDGPLVAAELAAEAPASEPGTPSSARTAPGSAPRSTGSRPTSARSSASPTTAGSPRPRSPRRSSSRSGP